MKLHHQQEMRKMELIHAEVLDRQKTERWAIWGSTGLGITSVTFLSALAMFLEAPYLFVAASGIAIGTILGHVFKSNKNN